MTFNFILNLFGYLFLEIIQNIIRNFAKFSSCSDILVLK